MFDTFADELFKAEVATRGGHLKNCSGYALVKNMSEQRDRSGAKAVLDLLIIKVDPTTNQDVNYSGESVAKQYRFEDGSADKRAAVKGNFKRDLCALARVDPSTVTITQWKAALEAANAGLFSGMVIRFEPYSSVTKAGADRVYHNITALPGLNAPQDVTKRAEALKLGKLDISTLL